MAVADVLFLVLTVVETIVGNPATVLNSLVFQYNRKGPKRAFLLFWDCEILGFSDLFGCCVK